MKHQLWKLNHQVLLTLVNNKKGFTLIEASVALVVLMIGIFSVIQFFPVGLQIIGDSQNRTVASSLAIAKLEEVRSSSYDEISTGTIEVKQPVSNDTTSYLNRYDRETVVTLVDSDFNVSVTDVGFKKITVTAYWQSPIGDKEKSTSVSTVIADF